MREYWVNVYKYWMAGEWYVLVGAQQFKNKSEALCYMPSVGLSVTYLIHVRLKCVK